MRCLLLVLGVALSSVAAAAELSDVETRVLQAIHATVQQAGVSYAAGNFEQAGEKIREAIEQVRIAASKGSADLYSQLEPAMQRIEKAHTLLEFEGVSLPPFQRPQRTVAVKPMVAEPIAEKSPSPARAASRRPGVRGEPSAPPGISFTSAVAPILINRCGRCHASDNKGGFNLGSYASLMQGPPEGVVVFAGDTVGSRLIETIETGDMPRGGGKVSPQELQLLKAWILDGAKFDGTDPKAPLVPGAAPAATATPTAEPAVRRATGKETVSFARDVAPLLVANCHGCHIDAMRTRGGLRMDTFAQLLQGGDSGAVIKPGTGETSLLVQKLRGDVGERMPAGGRPPLAEASIQLISTWIDEGATLDGASPTQPLSVMSQLAWAAAASSQQLSERRQQLADSHLQLVTQSGSKIQSKTTDHFLVAGPASPGTIELVARLAEEQMKTVKTVVAGEAGEAFFRGRATVFVLPKRYDYSEFAKMVEGRGIPANWSSHWSHDGIEAYAAVVATEQDDEDAIADRLAAPLVSLAVATRSSDVPRWLAEGAGVATASRNVQSRDREARRKEQEQIVQAVASMGSAKDFLDGKLSPEQSDRIGAAIATTMLDRTHRRNFDALLRLLAAGQPFSQAFAEAFRSSPAEFIDAWTKWVRGG
jgi:mono/diheme cytochrome c family protein